MGLVNAAPPTPQQATLGDINNAVVNGIQQRVLKYLQLYNLFWNNPYGLAPQDVAAALGTNAAVLFEIAAQEQSVLTAAAALVGAPLAATLPSPPTGWTVTPNADGSVTLTPPQS